MQALTQTELDKLLSGVLDLKLRVMIILGYRHGMRASEVCGLKWKDVDLESRIITVRRLKNSLTTRQPLSNLECELLKTLLDARRGVNYVFPSLRAKVRGERGPMSRITFWRMFRDACIHAGISNRSPHSLKHGLGRALVSANISLPIIKQALGHKSISSTAVYTVVDDETAGKIIQDVLR